MAYYAGGCIAWHPCSLRRVDKPALLWFAAACTRLPMSSSLDHSERRMPRLFPTLRGNLPPCSGTRAAAGRHVWRGQGAYHQAGAPDQRGKQHVTRMQVHAAPIVLVVARSTACQQVLIKCAGHRPADCYCCLTTVASLGYPCHRRCGTTFTWAATCPPTRRSLQSCYRRVNPDIFTARVPRPLPNTANLAAARLTCTLD